MSDKTASGACRITKTQRVAYTVLQADITEGVVSLPVNFDNPFVDTNYTATVGVSSSAPVDPSSYFAAGFDKRVDGVDVAVVVEAQAPGDVIEIHVHAIHD